MDTLDVTTLSRDVAAAQRLLASIDDELSTITRACRGPSDVDATLRKTEQIIDHRLARYKQHPLLGPVIVEMKKQYRGLILDQNRPTRSVGMKLQPWIKPG
jgi:hypothetical protein